MPREKIIRDFAEWTAFSATRSGCPVKSRKDVYPLIRVPKYDVILQGGRISPKEFAEWHEQSTKAICETNPKMPIGWAAKVINVYLKTRVYVAGEGRDGLIQYIHPPIDNGLWLGIMQEYHNMPEIIKKTHVVSRIKAIKDYQTYNTIIEGCRIIAHRRGCLLIEVEELWQGTNIGGNNAQNQTPQFQDHNFAPIPEELLERACRGVVNNFGELPFTHRGIQITRELIQATMEILNSAPDQQLPQNCRNAVRDRTPDGLDLRLKIHFNDHLRRANIISDVLAAAGIVEIVQIQNPVTGRIVKGTQLQQDWCWNT